MLSSLRGSHPSIHQPAAASRSAFLTESDVDLCQKSFICRGARGHGKRRTGLTFGTREVRLFILSVVDFEHRPHERDTYNV